MEEIEKQFRHLPVLLRETISELDIKQDGIYVDGTIGGGGHAYEVCKKLNAYGCYIGIDQDGDAIEAANERLLEFRDIVRIVRSNYCNMKQVISDFNISFVDGILLDLGVSSYQLDTKIRGFSYKEDAPLDMRMDNRQNKTAKDIINNYSEREIYRVIRDYGEDRFAKNIAKHIVRKREEAPIETTLQLVEAIKAAIPKKVQLSGGHPAKKTFQAIRIELNQELDVLLKTLDTMVDLLKPKGRLCIITFHSLEDRIVKSKFNQYERPCTCPPSFPICICGKKSKGIHISKKPILPSKEELINNSRSKSAKLRVFEKIS